MVFPLLALLPELMPIVGKLIDRIPDPHEREKAQLEAQSALLAASIKADSDQRDINKAEASSASLFVAGGRPAIIWICAFALAYTYVLVPLVMYASYALGHPIPKPPDVGVEEHLWELMTGLLGLSGMRSFDKMQGTATGTLMGTKK